MTLFPAVIGITFVFSLTLGSEEDEGALDVSTAEVEAGVVAGCGVALVDGNFDSIGDSGRTLLSIAVGVKG